MQEKSHSEEISEYGDYLDCLAQGSQNEIFLNSSAQHAAMVMSRIFKHSDKEVLIMARNLKGDVSDYEEYIIELMGFLSKGGKLRLMLNQYDSQNPPKLFKLLKLIPEKQVEIKSTSMKFLLNETKEEVHFTIGSKQQDLTTARMYRLEHDTNQYLATGNFNDTKIASELYSQFDLVFNSENAVKISLT